MSLFLNPRSTSSITWDSRDVSGECPIRTGRSVSDSNSSSIQLAPDATVRRHFRMVASGAVLRTTPAAPACRKRSASGCEITPLHTITEDFGPSGSQGGQPIDDRMRAECLIHQQDGGLQIAHRIHAIGQRGFGGDNAQPLRLLQHAAKPLDRDRFRITNRNSFH